MRQFHVFAGYKVGNNKVFRTVIHGTHAECWKYFNTQPLPDGAYCWAVSLCSC